MLHWTAMSPGGSRRPFFAVMAVALAIVVGVSAAGVWRADDASAASASGAALSVTVDRPLSLLTEPVAVTVSGELTGSLVGAKLVVRVEGPADSAHIGKSEAALPEAAKLAQTLGPTPTTTVTTAAPQAGSPPPSTSSTTSSTTTTLAPGSSSQADLEAGRLTMTVVLPPALPATAGAYLVVAEVKSGDQVLASGQTWVGKVAPRQNPLDVAFVLPAALGIHRDTAGVFYDTALQEAISPVGQGEGAGQAAGAAAGEGNLLSLLAAVQRFPGWNLTLALEPILLTQLRDMADGYTFVDASGKQVVVGSQDPRAQSADAVLAALRDLAARDSVEVAVSPYSGADLGMLAAEGWRDGFEQVQLGKQELQQTLSLGERLVGAYSPGLSLTSGGLACYAQASIDHIVVSDAIARLLTEPVDAGTVAVRARDVENDRATLVLASSGLSSVMSPPWDVGVFFAALAAELASTPRDAVVVTPGVELTIPPEAYLESIGGTLAGLAWVRTQTLTELLRAHSPGTRPVILNASQGAPAGYVEGALLDSLRAAHASVTDLDSVADPTRAQLEAAHRLLYVAESRWWWRPLTSPQEATIGLHFAEQAQQLAQAELDKMHFVGAGSGTMTGREGTVTLTVENKADYPVTATLRLGGTGLTLRDGETLKVELPPGRTPVAVNVVSASGPHRLDAQLLAGTTVVDHLSQPLRFITFGTLLPAVLVGGLCILVGLFFLIRSLLRSRRAAARKGAKPGSPPSPAASPPSPPPPAPPQVNA
jgi:hypothetical protein